jgi:tetratricopeptide (TPR) repeat protein
MIEMNQGRFDDAVADIRTAMDVSPLSAIIIANVGRPLLCAGRFAEAREWFAQALDVEPDFWIARGLMAMSHDAVGEHDLALRCLEQPVAPDTMQAMMHATYATVLARAGEEWRARRQLEQVLARARQEYVSPVRIAQIFVGLNDLNQAFFWLENSRADRSLTNNTYLPYDYALAPLRGDARFAAYVAEFMGARND